MNILILGSGGREHAFAWKIKQSVLCENLFIAPGNAGTKLIGNNININVNDFDGIKNFCVENKISIVVVGPEDPLVNGIYDYFKSKKELENIILVGPSKIGALLEGSKAFAKQFMAKYKIPTAQYKEFTIDNIDDGKQYINNHSLPIVLKADGLAAGKGVVICSSHQEAIAEFEEMISNKKFGEASSKVVIEEFLDGIEMSSFVFTDGKNYVVLPNAKDYKRIGEGDTGLNTGGMGAISPVPFANEIFLNKVEEKIIKPTIAGLQNENIPYQGFVFIGLIKVNDEPFVIEYNCRMGDPETEVVLPRLENDLVDLFIKMDTQKLNEVNIEHSPLKACTIVLTSGGYPLDYEKGKIINALPTETSSFIFHAGTKGKENEDENENENENEIVTNGGRVLAITSLEKDLKSAVAQSLANAALIQFEGKYYRSDIGWEFV